MKQNPNLICPEITILIYKFHLDFAMSKKMFTVSGSQAHSVSFIHS